MVPRTLTEGFSQDRHVLTQVGFLDKAIWPKSIHQFFLLHYLPGALNKHLQCVKRLWLKRNGLSVCGQNSLESVHLKRTEVIKAFWHVSHRLLEKLRNSEP